jgi:hypothetical protein
VSRALILIAPLIKYTAGPLLGPAMLAGAGRAAGHVVDVLDLNAEYIAPRLEGAVSDGPIVGDHDKPERRLREIAATFAADLEHVVAASSPLSTHIKQPVMHACFELGEVLTGARNLLAGAHGRWMHERLSALPGPDVVGLSVLYGGQVIWTIAVSMLARILWPRATVVWGGPHITAIAESIAGEPDLREVVDGFVVGYAERTWVEILDAVAGNNRTPAGLNCPGEGKVRRADEDAEVRPAFDDLRLYGTPRVTLPAQFSRGCAYARCTFCTYPSVEAVYRPLGPTPLRSVFSHAERIGAVVSIKDSLVLPERLEQIAHIAHARVGWSACTKLHPRVASLATTVAARGCRTLEVGLETLVAESQQTIFKRQSQSLLENVLSACAGSGIAVVVNYITGFPGERPEEAAEALEAVGAICSQYGGLVRLELNEFQLERLAPIVRDVTVRKAWPLASVLDWEPRRARLAIVRGAA